MPVTATLSKAFYEKFGDDVTQELVRWFNEVDATYRADLRELNELNFARFEAKLEQRWSQLDAKMGERVAELRAHVDDKLDATKSALLRWLFGFWATTTLSVIGLFLGLILTR